MLLSSFVALKGSLKRKFSLRGHSLDREEQEDGLGKSVSMDAAYSPVSGSSLSGVMVGERGSFEESGSVGCISGDSAVASPIAEDVFVAAESTARHQDSSKSNPQPTTPEAKSGTSVDHDASNPPSHQSMASSSSSDKFSSSYSASTCASTSSLPSQISKSSHGNMQCGGGAANDGSKTLSPSSSAGGSPVASATKSAPARNSFDESPGSSSSKKSRNWVSRFHSSKKVS